MALCREPETRWGVGRGRSRGAPVRTCRAFRPAAARGVSACGCVVKGRRLWPWGGGVLPDYGPGGRAGHVRRRHGAGGGIKLREAGHHAANSGVGRAADRGDSGRCSSHAIMPTVYTVGVRPSPMVSAPCRRGTVGGRYHLAIETGMNRIGRALYGGGGVPAEHRFLIAGLACDGVFTHFATADDPDGAGITSCSASVSTRPSAPLKDAGLACGTVHLRTTPPATIFDPASHYDMVRGGASASTDSRPARARVAGIELAPRHERAGARGAHDASRDGRGRGVRLYLPCATHDGSDLHPAHRLCRRSRPHALQSHGGALPRAPSAPGGQHLHGPVHGRHSAEPGASAARGPSTATL